MAIKITSDSTCDLSAEQLKLHNIELFPLCISMGNQCLRDGLEITPDDIYAHVERRRRYLHHLRTEPGRLC